MPDAGHVIVVVDVDIGHRHDDLRIGRQIQHAHRLVGVAVRQVDPVIRFNGHVRAGGVKGQLEYQAAGRCVCNFTG